MKQKAHGFTIVELVVVIVIIGILAAITVVSYQHIQRQARNTAVIHDAQAWLRFLTTMYARQGTFVVDDLPAGSSSLCLGTKAQYPAVTGLQAGQCWQSGWTSDKFEAAMAKIGAVNMTTSITDNGSTPGRGLVYQQMSSTSAVINYDLYGENQDCTAVSGGYTHNATANGLTECRARVEEVVGGIPIRY